MTENSLFDKKSLRVVNGKTADFRELSKDCVAFANAQGGHIHIGIEDNATLPPQNQKIDETLLVKIQKQIHDNTQNVFVQAEKVIAKNGGEYIDLSVFPSKNSVASTSDGKYFLRNGDASKPLLPDELTRLFNDRPSFIWETKRTSFRIDEADSLKKSRFIADIKISNRVSNFLKEKTDNEIYENYQMSDTDGFLTNLGILWLGTQQQRARLCYSPVVQIIKRDEKEQKTNKWVYDDYSLNPKEMLEKIMQDIPDWKENYEVEDGLFRKTIPAYDNVVIRELLVNALAHRPYTTRGDVFINIFPTYMTIRNPGLLPFGVTPKKYFE